ncbi:MAG: HlyD family efflux transporter periplasmic adaptor subunit [Lachnospiraceae bacterium]|nr:HlyD family efflux transporter periplasmic adaptor subunit [Lachnospiraceae bacterium]
MEKERELGRKQIIKKVAVIFLATMLVLTFFSNTIMNYSLPEVDTESVTSGVVSNKVRGQGAVETNSDYEVTVSGSRVIKEVKVEVGDTVKKGDVLFTFEEAENEDLNTAEDELAQKELTYTKDLLDKLPPDYTDNNVEIQNAKEALSKAEEQQKEAKKTKKALKTAKKEKAQLEKDVATQEDEVTTLQEQFDAYGEVGDYNAAVEAVTTLEEDLGKARLELSDLKEDLKDEQELGGDTKLIERQIRDKEAEISKKETELKNSKEKVSTLEKILPSYQQTKDKLEKAKKRLEDLNEELTKKTDKVTELEQKPTLEDAKEAVETCKEALEKAIRTLDTTKKLNEVAEQKSDLEMKAAREEIEELRDKVEKLKSSSDIKEVKATDAGVVCQLDYKEGDKVNADTVLAKIQMSESGYLVKIKVTKAQSKLIKVGDEATVENVWDEDLVAEVKSIKADPENPNQSSIVTFEVKGNVDVGQNLSLSVGDKSNRYDAVVPNSAIKEDSNGKFVLIVTVKGTPLGNRYKIKRADVEVLASDDTSSGVSGGVYEYDNVVTNSSKPLEEGMQVRLVD